MVHTMRATSLWIASMALVACANIPAAATPAAPLATPAPTALAQPSAVPTAAAPTALAQPSAVPTQAPTSVSVVPIATAPPLARTLQLEQPALNGKDVQTLQQRLLELGYTQLGEADGVFGANTEAAVRAFQTLNFLEIDGVVGPNTWSVLYQPEAVRFELHPIVDTNSGYFLGAVNGQDWVEAGRAGSLIGETTYQLLAQQGSPSQAVGSPPESRGEPCIDTRYVSLDESDAADRPIGIAADWNVLPRPVTELPTTTAELAAPVSLALQALGLMSPTVQLSQVLRADIEGNGSQETIVVATYRASGTEGPQPSASVGDYSMLTVIPDGATVASVIAADVVTTDIEFGAPLEYRLLGLWDLNNDGTLELAATASYYEGTSTIVYELNGTAAKEVLVEGCGA